MYNHNRTIFEQFALMLYELKIMSDETRTSDVNAFLKKWS